MLTENDFKTLTQIFDRKLEAQFNLFKDALGEFAQELHERLDRLELKTDKLETRMDDIENRMNKLESKFTLMEQSIEKRFDRLEFKVDKLHSEIAVHRIIIGEQETRIKAVERDLLSNYIIQDKPRKETK